MDLYTRSAEGKPIKAYINVGGGTVSVGKNIGKLMFRPGSTGDRRGTCARSTA